MLDLLLAIIGGVLGGMVAGMILLMKTPSTEVKYAPKMPPSNKKKIRVNDDQSFLRKRAWEEES